MAAAICMLINLVELLLISNWLPLMQLVASLILISKQAFAACYISIQHIIICGATTGCYARQHTILFFSFCWFCCRPPLVHCLFVGAALNGWLYTINWTSGASFFVLKIWRHLNVCLIQFTRSKIGSNLNMQLITACKMSFVCLS